MKKILFVLTMFVFGTTFALDVSVPGGGFIREKMFKLQVDNAPALMKINYNGIPFIAKSGGTFTRSIMASRGMNTISISDYDNFNNSDSVSFFADVPPTAMKIIMFWDTDKTDIDLHVIEPDKTECYYGHKNTKLGGRLDIDVTTGYGPEIYTMEYPNLGTYEVFAHFYGGQELTEVVVVFIINEGTSTERRETFTMMVTQRGSKVFIGKVDVK